MGKRYKVAWEGNKVAGKKEGKGHRQGHNGEWWGKSCPTAGKVNRHVGHGRRRHGAMGNPTNQRHKGRTKSKMFWWWQKGKLCRGQVPTKG